MKAPWHFDEATVRTGLVFTMSVTM